MSTPSKSKKSPRVTVDVTQEIIDQSTQRDSSHCMIADALRAAVPEAMYVSVDLATIRFTDLNAGYRYVYLTPRHAQAALLDFDQGKKPEPFSLELVGAHVLTTGNSRKARARLEPSGRGGGTIPVRVGGSSPPEGPLSNKMIGTPAERRQAVRTAIEKAVAANPEASNRQIATIADVAVSTVARHRTGKKGAAAMKAAARAATATSRRREFGLRAIVR